MKLLGRRQPQPQWRTSRTKPLAIALTPPLFLMPAARAVRRLMLPTSTKAGIYDENNGELGTIDDFSKQDTHINESEKAVIATPGPAPPQPPPPQASQMETQPLPQSQSKPQSQNQHPKGLKFSEALRRSGGTDFKISPQVGAGVSVGCFAGTGYGLAVGMGSVAATSVTRNTALVVPFGKAQAFAHDGAMVGAFCGVMIGGGFASGVGAHFGYRWPLFDDWIESIRGQLMLLKS